MMKVCERQNLQAALKTVKGTRAVLVSRWDDRKQDCPTTCALTGTSSREQLLTRAYRPAPVRRQLIPKGTGGMRARHSYGARSVHPAGPASGSCNRCSIQASRSTATAFDPGGAHTTLFVKRNASVQEGRRWVVDVDLEKILPIASTTTRADGKAREADRRQTMLGLIRRYRPNAGIMVGRWWWNGTRNAAGGGHSRRCSQACCSIDIDKELEKRGHASCAADDCNVYVRSRRAGNA